MPLDQVKEYCEIASYIATVIGIPVAIMVFYRDRRTATRENEIDSYMKSADKYINYVTLCLQYPELNVLDCHPEEKLVKQSGLSPQQLALFTILVSTIETAYLLYRNQRSEIRQSQFKGWHAYMVYWTGREDFHRAWEAVGDQLDINFQKEINTMIENAKANNRVMRFSTGCKKVEPA